MESAKCSYCGYDVHQSSTVICDTITAYPLPYKISYGHYGRSLKNTEPLKILTTHTMKKEPQFNTITFVNNTQLALWVNKMADAAIHLKDFGQDMQVIYVHKSGEILNTDFNQDIYIGKFVNMEKLVVNRCLEIWNNETECYDTYAKLIPEEIIY